MVTLIYGNEPYLISNEKTKIKANIISCPEMNIYETTEFNEQAYEYACQYPFASDSKVLFFCPEELKENDLLKKYLNDISSSTHLVIIPLKVDKRLSIFKTIQNNFNVIECKKVTKDVLKKYILKYITQNGGLITEKAMDTFIVRINYDVEEVSLYDVRSYMDKVLAFDKKIYPDTIELLIPKTIEENVFTLTDLLLNKKVNEAYALLDVLLNSKENNPILILSSMLRNYRLAYKINLYKDYDNKAISIKLGINTFIVNKLKNLSDDYIKYGIEEIENAISSIKKGVIDGIFITRVVVGKILNKL